MLQKLQARGIKSFNDDMLEFIEPNLNIDDLLNIRKYYNDILRSKDFKNASFKHLQAINKEIDLAVENALQDIAQQSGINTAKLLKNYKDINKEYADYAKFKESDFYKDSVKTKKREKDLSEDNFNKAILKQAQREEGFNNKVFNRIANNTDTNLQAQAIKELIQRNIANGNGQFRAVKWQELIQDLEKIEHSITDEGLKNLVSNLKQAQRLYNGDNEFLQAIQRSVGSKPANVLISSANGLFGRTLLLFYNFVHKIMARFAGALSENLAHQSLEDQLGKALRYARNTKDFIHVSIDSISKNLPKEDKETSKVLKELEYWKAQFDKDDIASFYTIKDAQETQIAITAHKQELQERKEVIDNALSEARKDIETIQREVIESNPNFMPTRQIDDFDNEATYKMEVEFDKLGMQEFQRKIESGEIQLDKPTQKTLENAYSQYNHLLQKRELLEKDLQSFKAFDDNNILKTNSTLIAQTQRVLNQIQDDISFTKEAIKDIESELSTSNKALMPLNTRTETKKEIHAFSNLLDKPKEKDISPLAQYDKVSQYGTTGSHVERSETSNVTQGGIKPSFATNLMKQDTQGLIPYNSTQANNALIPYSKPQDTKLLAYNETKLLEYKETLHALQKLDKSFKDFMSMPFSIIVDSKGNALPLTSQAIKNFIFHNLYKEFLNTTKALNKPLAQLDFKSLSNEIKALPYKANANLKAHLRDINAKTNELLDSMQELKNTTKEIKLLPYNKPSENKAVEVDRFRNVLGEMPKTRDYQVITDKKAFIENLNVLKSVAEPIPPTLDIHAFLKTLDNVENKENFIEHLSTRDNAETRLAYLNLVEPTLKRADIELTFLPNKKEYIKSFKDKDNNLLYLLVTKDNDKTLITGIPNPAERYVRSEINKADIIHSFVPQDRQTTEVVNGLSTQNPTTKQEISKDIESKSTQEIENIQNTESAKPQKTDKVAKEQINNTLDDTADTLFWIWSDFANELDTLSKKAYYNLDTENIQNLASGLRLYGDYDDVLNDIKADIFKRYINNDTMGKYHILTPHPDSKKPKEFLEKLNIRFTDKKIEKEVKSLFKQATEKEAELLNKANKDLQELFQQRDMPTQKELSKESKSTQEPVTQKETTRASGEKSSNETLTQAKEYTNLIDDFLYQYDLKDDLWFLKYAKLQNAHNRDEVGAALKNWHEVRDNVSIKYDDYVAATEQVKNSLNRAALDIIDDFKATDEALEAIEKIQTKLLDDYPFNQSQSIDKPKEKTQIEH